MGFVSDLVHGKEKTYGADPLAKHYKAIGKDGARFTRANFKELKRLQGDAVNTVQSQIGRENSLMRGAAEDAARRTRELVARRGMQNSSIGLGQEVQDYRQLQDNLAQNNATALDRMRGLVNENINVGKGMLSLYSNAANSMQMRPTTARTGGYGQLLIEGGKAYASSGASAGN